MNMNKMFKIAAVSSLIIIAYSCNKAYEMKGDVEGGYDQETYEIVSQNCYQCHANGNSEGDFGTIDSSTDMIESGYITPDNPSLSPLYLKITNPTFGEKMPYKGPYLKKSQTDKILSWISTLSSTGDGTCDRLDDFTGTVYTWTQVKEILTTTNLRPVSGTSYCITCHNAAGGSASRWVISPTATPADATHTLVLSSGTCGAGMNTPCTPYSGAMVVPGDPCNSRLYRRVSQSSKPSDFSEAAGSWLMPSGAVSSPTGTQRRFLTLSEKTIIFNWIKQGALDN